MKDLVVYVPPDSPELLVPYLTTIEAPRYAVKKISGALTNVIYKLTIIDTNETYLIRIYGTKDDSLVDRSVELDNIRRIPDNLNVIKILYFFQNGRIELFLDDFRAILSEEMRRNDYFELIAQQFRDLHSSVQLYESEIKGLGFVWTKILSWIEIIDSMIDCNKTNLQIVNSSLLCKDWNSFKAVVLDYKDWLLEHDSESFENFVFCHNDTQQGNIMINPKRKDVVFIDFEYGGANALSFDISNFFTECMHNYNLIESYDCKSEFYPTKDQIMLFLKKYLHEDVKEKNIHKLYNSVIRWRATAQLFWSIWAVIQSDKLSKELEMEESDDDAITLSSTSETLNYNDDYFNYLSFCKSKISYFWGDLIKFNIVNESACQLPQIRFLGTELFETN
ncbi:hypothetical protein KAFR_0B05750 [Kazachstania africana CBS 2517]|uniref:Choline kinase N-terminal domain-containing protein n=1 Tax=Kazachstania africana (strain ATCC 22294 / BCRC 22015 / CBS 2517 / CECT 1963 / NBRC 1671 / NRRL Y-8276) TaxID=1071382 RepID=H2AR71_KAZAF|nr:hypothetical protein KAFR_0B05750 [Kazachstania africana CBS 2517]CCF56871.1 hypothetical protein KAFR_0B05750 [Kazachstania africana CBS 2517]